MQTFTGGRPQIRRQFFGLRAAYNFFFTHLLIAAIPLNVKAAFANGNDKYAYCCIPRLLGE